MNVNLPAWKFLINLLFIPLMYNTDRYLILYGGRGSGKSDAIAKKLIKRCLTEKFFRYVLFRNTYNTIKDSQFKNIKDIVHEWGLESLFSFKESPLEINCINGNSFLCRGGDDPKKLKSIKDPTGIWYEEELPTRGDFLTMTTSIRTKKASYLQEVFTINPEVDGDYTEHWFWRTFFSGHTEFSFSDSTAIELPNGSIYYSKYTVHHSTYRDNRWVPDSFVALLIDLARTDEYYNTVYTEGLWGNRSSTGNFYKLFKRSKNVLVKTHEYCQYNPNLPLRLTFDFNVHPYVTLLVHQVVGKRSTQIDEICLPTPNNKTDLACKEFIRRYRGHAPYIYVYGDPSGVHEDTRTEKGYNDFIIIQRELLKGGFKVQMAYEKSAPPIHTRGMFINDVFSVNFADLEFYICETCSNTLADYQQLKEAADGTKAKIRVKNEETQVSYEKYGHTSDANDYMYCSIFKSEFIQFQRSGTALRVSTGANLSKNSY